MSKGVFQIDGLAGYRIDVVGFDYEDGYALVSSIVADSEAEAEAELSNLLADEAYADWPLLWSAPNAAWSEACFLGEVAQSGIRIR